LTQEIGLRVSNNNSYSEVLFRTAEYRSEYPSRLFGGMEQSCHWVAATSFDTNARRT
jgi:hypothetical protein